MSESTPLDPRIATVLGLDPSKARLAPEMTLEPLKPPTMPEVESAIRLATIAQAKAAILQLAELLDDPKTVARSLHLIASTAETYKSFLATLGIPGARKSSRGSYATVIDGSNYNVSPAEPLMQPLMQVDVDSVEASVPFGAETMGNQALGQIISMLKPLLGPLFSRATEPSIPSRRENGFEVESLTRALAEASRAELDPKIIEALKSRLESAIVVGTENKETAVVEPTTPAAFAAGLAGGIAAGAAVEISESEEETE